MALALKYGDLKSAATQSDKLASSLGGYCDSLSEKVQRKMYSVEGGMSSALTNADYYVKRKINQLRVREANARALATKITNLRDTAIRVDNDVKSMIGANQKALFDKNPGLKPSKTKQIVTIILNVANKIPFIGSLIKLTVKASSAIANLCKSIKDWWMKGGWKVVVLVVAIVVLAVLAVVTSGLVAVICVGLLIGLVSQGVSDIFSGKMSSWESYVGSAIGGAAGMIYGTATGNWANSGAIMSGTTSLVTGALEMIAGKREKSWNAVVELSIETAISAGVSLLIGKSLSWASKIGVVKNLSKSADSMLAKVVRGSGAKSGVLTGKGSMLGSFRGQMTKLVTGSTTRITGTTIKNAVVSVTYESLKKGLSKKIERATTDLAMNKMVTPIINNAKQTPAIAQFFKYKVSIPNPRVVGDSIKNIREWIGRDDIYRFAPAM